MKITSDVFELLMKAVNVGKIMGIDEIAMEDNEKGCMFRGMADAGGTPVVMLQDIDIDLPFSGLGVQHSGSFIVKEKLAYTNDNNYTIYAQIDSMTNNVKTLDFKGNKFKMAVNTAKTNIIRAPKAIKDIDAVGFEINEDEVKSIEQAVRAFGKAELVEVVCDGEHITLELKSSEDGGSFSFELEYEIAFFNCDEYSFVHSYPVKTFLNLIKHSEMKLFKIGKQGILNGHIEDIKMYIFPRRM